MASVRANTSGGGGGTKIARGFYASSADLQQIGNSITTKDEVTGVAFKPKKITWITIYGGNDTMGGYYDEDNSPNTYERYFTNKTTISLPQSSYTGLKQITSTGFELHDTSNFASFYYVAEG